MNVNTNHLIQVDDSTKIPEDYMDVPENLNRAARRALKGEREVTISRTSGGKLSRWASKQQKLKRKSSYKKKVG